MYWATNDGFKGGRDPMGIQNSSIATYGRSHGVGENGHSV